MLSALRAAPVCASSPTPVFRNTQGCPHPQPCPLCSPHPGAGLSLSTPAQPGFPPPFPLSPPSAKQSSKTQIRICYFHALHPSEAHPCHPWALHQSFTLPWSYSRPAISVHALSHLRVFAHSCRAAGNAVPRAPAPASVSAWGTEHLQAPAQRRVSRNHSDPLSYSRWHYLLTYLSLLRTFLFYLG